MFFSLLKPFLFWIELTHEGKKNDRSSLITGKIASFRPSHSMKLLWVYHCTASIASVFHYPPSGINDAYILLVTWTIACNQIHSISVVLKSISVEGCIIVLTNQKPWAPPSNP
jgi:hypothetical protein